MDNGLEVRPSRPADAAALDMLYGAVFPDEELRPMVRALEALDADVISLIADAEGAVVGHVAFTLCGVAGADVRVALLGPLAVHPSWRKRGLGAALVRAGLADAAEAQARGALVLGDPAYYARFGFAPERRIAPPYALPDGWADAWRSLSLTEAPLELDGELLAPPPWRRPELWSA